MYRPLLTDTTRDYVIRFAAESLSYMMRKVKDKRSLFVLLLDQVKRHPDQASGVGNVIFEMLKGPKSYLHT